VVYTPILDFGFQIIDFRMQIAESILPPILNPQSEME